MAHYAKVENDLVTQVIVADASFFDTFVDSSPGKWLQTSYNTSGGIHSEGGTPLRKNFAGVGCTYDVINDAFIPLKPYPSWVLNDTTCLWSAPTAYPDDGKDYNWNEDTTSWVETSGET
tara:strand:+ start:83 stop:439 length:357 start_codon:yes stop_codon:yes gene_type:complete